MCIVLFGVGNYILSNEYCIATTKGLKVAPLDTNEIIKEAREMRAVELRRMQGLMTARMAVYLRLLAGSLAALGESLRPFFSWNPQDPVADRRIPNLFARANDLLRACFSWNPQAHRS